MKKMALFAFNGEVMCFIHVLLNALDLKERGYEVTVVVEGAAVQVIPELAQADHPMYGLYREARSQGLLAGACRACAVKLKVDTLIEKVGLPLISDMKGHVSMGRYLDEGYQVITF